MMMIIIVVLKIMKKCKIPSIMKKLCVRAKIWHIANNISNIICKPNICLENT